MKETELHPLRFARVRRNLTIEQLATAANVGTATVWRAEHHHSISAESRQRLCEFFHMSSQALGLIGGASDEEGQIPGPLALGSPPQHLQEALPTITIPHRPPRQADAGLWLAGEANQLASLFEEHWDLETIVKSLHIVLQSLQVFPLDLRRTLFQTSRPNKISLTLEERRAIEQALDKSIYLAWQFHHESHIPQLFIVANALLSLLRRIDALLEEQTASRLYAGIYNLTGAALYDQGEYEASRWEHEQSYAAATRGKDLWLQVQSCNWLAIVANATGQYLNAVHFLENALHLLEEQKDQPYPHTQAHLLANWAYNAALLEDQAIVREKLRASLKMLETLDSDEEFDLASWHRLAGRCELMNGRYSTAIKHFEESLTQIPSQWHTRRVLSLLPLAEAYAYKREKEASLIAAEQATQDIRAADSVMLKQRLLEYQQILLDTFPHDRAVRSFIAQNIPLLRIEHTPSK